MKLLSISTLITIYFFYNVSTTPRYKELLNNASVTSKDILTWMNSIKYNVTRYLHVINRKVNDISRITMQQFKTYQNESVKQMKSTTLYYLQNIKKRVEVDWKNSSKAQECYQLSNHWMQEKMKDLNINNECDSIDLKTMDDSNKNLTILNAWGKDLIDEIDNSITSCCFCQQNRSFIDCIRKKRNFKKWHKTHLALKKNCISVKKNYEVIQQRFNKDHVTFPCFGHRLAIFFGNLMKIKSAADDCLKKLNTGAFLNITFISDDKNISKNASTSTSQHICNKPPSPDVLQ